MTSIANICLPGQRPQMMPVLHRCRTCSDLGLVRVEGQPPAQNGSESEIWRAMMPCICEAGNEHRAAYEWYANPPLCSCGLPAAGNGFGPTCEGCYPIRLAKWRGNA